MFEAFRARFVRDAHSRVPVVGRGAADGLLHLGEFLSEFGGGSFNEGLYRVVEPAEQRLWNERINYVFPEFALNTFACFGYDWQGRAFALDKSRSEAGMAGVLMFDTGSDEVFDIPFNLPSFHDVGLIEELDAEALLERSMYGRWLASGHPPPAYDQCVGYHIPLFLGGADDITNLGIIDMDVYWVIHGQLLHKTRHLPPGTKLPKFTISD